MDDREEAPCTEALRKLSGDIEAFALRAKDAAISLYTISHACTFLSGTKECQCDIANRLFAVVGIMSFSTLSSEQPSLAVEEVEVLSKSIAACDSLLDTIEAAVNRADEYVRLGSTLRYEKGSHRLAFTSDGLVQAQRVLQSVFQIVARMTMKARNEDLGRLAGLTDDETLEALRLSEALKHPDQHVMTHPVVSLSSHEIAPHRTNISPVLRNSLPYTTKPQPQPRLQLQPNNIPIRACNQWPPYRSSFADYGDYQREIQSMMEGAGINNDKILVPTDTKKEDSQNTPASTRENTPAAEPEQTDVAGKPKDTVEAASKAPQGSTSQNTEKTMNKALPPPPPHAIMEPSVKKSMGFKFGSLDHLEAYILRAQVDTSKDSVTWSTTTELLHLDKAALQADVDKLGSDYSITKAMGELLPDQVRLVQARTKSRHGHLVSVQQGVAADMVTPMGTFQTKPVIFVIRTAAFSEKEEQYKPAIPTIAQDEKKPAFGGFSTGFLPFGPPQPVPTAPSRSGFLYSNAPVAGFLVESDGTYQTITSQQPYLNYSLEELRLRDYYAGRTGLAKLSGSANPREHQQPNGMQSEKPFGGQYSNPKAGFGSGFSAPLDTYPAPGRLFGDASSGGGGSGPPWGGGGIFGSSTPSGQPPQPTGGLFGRPFASGGLFGGPGFGGPSTHSNTGAGLFGQRTTSGPSLFGTTPPAPSSGSLFGQPANASSSGLFGQRTTPGPSLFGTTPSALSSGSLFGQPANASSTGLFGVPPATSTTGPSLFGATPALQPTGGFGRTSMFPSLRLPQSAASVPSTGLFGAASASPSGPSLFGAKAPTTSLFGTATGGFGQPQSSLFNFNTASKQNNPSEWAESPSDDSYDESLHPAPWTCKKCATSLVFHPAAEQRARLCDACNGNKETTCWLCERKVAKSTTNTNTDANATPPPPAKPTDQPKTEEKTGSTDVASPSIPVPAQAAAPAAAETEPSEHTAPRTHGARFIANEHGEVDLAKGFQAFHLFQFGKKAEETSEADAEVEAEAEQKAEEEEDAKAAKEAEEKEGE